MSVHIGIIVKILLEGIMGIGSGSLRFICELSSRGIFSDVQSVCEAGSQELHLAYKRFNEIVQSHGILDYSRDAFSDLIHWPTEPWLSSRALYSILGIKNYTCIDLNGAHGSIVHDLNCPFEDRSRWELFDLVTDFGNNEHCFNVMEAYRTLHRILKPGGYMIIGQARYAETNGYYLMDESFYEGLAAANGYKIVQICYIVSPVGQEEQLLLPFNRNIMEVVDLNKNQIMITTCFQKTKSADFVIPYQGNFLSERTGNAGYIASAEREPIVRSYLPIEDADKVVDWAIQTQPHKLIEQLVKLFPEEIKSVLSKTPSR